MNYFYFSNFHDLHCKLYLMKAFVFNLSSLYLIPAWFTKRGTKDMFQAKKLGTDHVTKHIWRTMTKHHPKSNPGKLFELQLPWLISFTFKSKEPMPVLWWLSSLVRTSWYLPSNIVCLRAWTPFQTPAAKWNSFNDYMSRANQSRYWRSHCPTHTRMAETSSRGIISCSTCSQGSDWSKPGMSLNLHSEIWCRQLHGLRGQKKQIC